MNAIVVGGAGFIGHHLVKRLLGEGWDVVIVDNLHSGKSERMKLVQARRAILMNGMNITKELVKKADVVFNMAAARPNWEFVMKYPEQTVEANVALPGHLARLCVEAKIPLIHSSSSSVYGWSHDFAWSERQFRGENPGVSEEDDLIPANTYGFQKATADSIIEDLQPKACLLRYFNVYGPGQDPKSRYTGVITKFLEQKRNRKKLTVYGTGQQSRDFTFVFDVVDAIMLAYKYAKRRKGVHTFNIGSGKPASVIDIANTISPEGEFDFRPNPPGDVQCTKANTSKAQNALGWKPSEMTVFQFIEDALTH